MTDVQKGGNVIGSGGFGCVFSPQLRCENIRGPPKPNMISKLMMKKNALEEYHLIKEIQKILMKIPHYTLYFLLNDISVCRPRQLTDAELAQYASKCHMLEKYQITPNTINSNLSKLSLLNMPRGGITIDKYIETNILNINRDFVIINNNLIGLLLNGIIKMNRLGVYHCDLKSSNVLVDEQLLPRIIDWGLSNHGVRGELSEWRYYSVQFNTPFTSVIFGKHFESWMMRAEPTDENSLRTAITRFVEEYMGKQRHMGVIINIFFMLFFEDIPESIKTTKAQKAWVYKNIVVSTISDYIYIVSKRFSIVGNAGSINPVGLKRYLNTVYLHLVDIWGFIMIYLCELEILYQNLGNLNADENHLYVDLRKIFIKYLYSVQLKAINVHKLADDLRRLNGRFKSTGYNIHSSSTLERYTSYQKQKRKLGD